MIAGFPTLICVKDQCESVNDGLRCMRRAGHPSSERYYLPETLSSFLDPKWHWNGVNGPIFWIDDQLGISI